MKSLLLPNMFRTTSVIAENEFFSLGKRSMFSTIFQSTEGNNEDDTPSDSPNDSLPSPVMVMAAEALNGCAMGVAGQTAFSLVVAYLASNTEISNHGKNIVSTIAFIGAGVGSEIVFATTDRLLGISRLGLSSRNGARGYLLFSSNGYSIINKIGFGASSVAGIMVCSELMDKFYHEIIGLPE